MTRRAATPRTGGVRTRSSLSVRSAPRSRSRSRRAAPLTLAAAACLPLHLSAQQPVTIRAGTLIDGRGGVVRDVVIEVRADRITGVRPAGGTPATLDLSAYTVLPGLIDTHVHIGNHFGADGRASNEGESPAERILYAAENAYATLMAGFTTVQSIGSPSDVELRAALARGVLPGPRLLTSISALSDTTLAPVEIRAWVRRTAAGGADVIKIFASRSIREGGAQTLSDAQIRAACDEARAVGKRIWVHAHAASAARASALAGCTAVTHGSQVTDAELALMAQRGTFFEPNIGLVSQNYLENRDRFLGTANYDERGFRFMEEGIPLKLEMFRRALGHPSLLLLAGTDAVAGAHGQNAREIVYRVRVAGQPAMDAIRSATSVAARSLGLEHEIGSIADGMMADVIAVEGDPLQDITALQRVVFVMRAGRVYRGPAR
ncbi:MAG: amidohydrolase family protein [Gemmatimonadetes bacterium]|nr:amidohydrolase family protein [Gemmatimonadota bacterium]